MRAKRSAAKKTRAYAMLFVLVILALSILAFSSIARWTSTTAKINNRNNDYSTAVAAAEGATERAVSYIARDFFRQSFVPSNIRLYGSLVPTNDWASDYEFSDGAGAVNRLWAQSTPTLITTNLSGDYEGLYGMVYECKVRANARMTSEVPDLTGAVQQAFQLAAIPVFQFAIFYSMDLEINPGPVMQITGKVHSNANIYTSPGSGLEYLDAVTAVGQIYNYRAPNDPNTASGVAPQYDSIHKGGQSSLTLPVGTNNNPSEVRKIIEVPPVGENANSDLGRERYYNKADLLVITTGTNVLVRGGNWAGFVILPSDLPGTNGGYSFIKTNPTFQDTRENKPTLTTEIDVGAFRAWMTNLNATGGATLNNTAKIILGHQFNSIYVDDQRNVAGKLTVVRVTNGQTLPQDGLTVATRLPLYVQGQFNAPIVTPGSTNTTTTKPSSLVGDSITILSGNWRDTNSTKALSSRVATDTTVNAAFLAGIVESAYSGGSKHYSGGVENYPRFLEDWNSKTFTYNGSMVVMYASQYATNFWVTPGTYYNAPTRKWAFDLNFKEYTKLPPLTPLVRKVIRLQWNTLAANTPN